MRDEGEERGTRSRRMCIKRMSRTASSMKHTRKLEISERDSFTVLQVPQVLQIPQGTVVVKESPDRLGVVDT
jgi:hypothetical protein